MLNLPKKYLSYSQFNTWIKNKEAYRARYYRGEKQHENPEMIFGKQIAKMLEDPAAVDAHPVLSKIPRYSVSEHPIKVDVDGVPVIGYIDSFDPVTKSFIEYKTGHLNKDGQTPWNTVSIRKHEQLPFYSLLVELSEGEVNRVCHLVWMETRFKEKSIEFDGHTLTAGTRELELTGIRNTFKRIITKWERKRIRDLIKKVAGEISEDFTNYQKTHDGYKEMVHSIGEAVLEKTPA